MQYALQKLIKNVYNTLTIYKKIIISQMLISFDRKELLTIHFSDYSTKLKYNSAISKELITNKVYFVQIKIQTIFQFLKARKCILFCNIHPVLKLNMFSV